MWVVNPAFPAGHEGHGCGEFQAHEGWTISSHGA